MAKTFPSGSPDSQAHPENRHGTRSYRGYLLHLIRGNCGNASRLVRATNRQNKKVRNFIESRPSSRTPFPKGWGPTMRAIYRDYIASWYDDSGMAHF